MIELPNSCKVNKIIHKKTFYEKVNVSNSIKEEFVGKLNKIYWKYKISENTTNITKTDNIEEIEVFELDLKEKSNCKNIIKIITKNIPYPILFCIKYENDFQYAIKYNEDIFFSEWNNEIYFNFKALNTELIYNNIVKSITNINQSIEDLDEEIQRKNEILRLENEIKKLENKMRSEKQFNIKVQYNEQINKLKYESKVLKNNEQ